MDGKKIYSIIFLISYHCVLADTIPPPKCSLSSPTLNACLTTFAKNFADKIPKNLKTDDVLIGKLVLTGVKAVYFETNDMTICNMQDSFVEDIQLDHKNKKLTIAINFSGKISLSGTISGAVVASPITTKTKFFLEIYDTVGVYEMNYTLKRASSGKEYMKILTHLPTFYVGPIKIGYGDVPPEDEHFRNLFNLAVAAFGGNRDMLINGWGEEFLGTIAKKFVKYIEDLLSQMPFSDLVTP